MKINRRHFLFLLTATAGIGTLRGLTDNSRIALADEDKVYTLPPLPYNYDALEPYIDAETMRFHHDKHHATYTKNLNMAIAPYPELKTKTPEELLQNIDTLPENIRVSVRNNGGGYVNHSIFWNIMGPGKGGEPTGAIAKAISDTFGSFAAFKEQFNKAGNDRFGSGWVWLALDPGKALKIVSLPNQDSPISQGMYPIMGNDVWEHAYYLKYRNNRVDYLNNWWNVVNWEEVNKRYEAGIKI